MLKFSDMGRRGKSKDLAIFEAMSGLAGFAVLLWVISPAFRALTKIALVILLLLVFISVAVAMLWLLIREFKKKSLESLVETATSTIAPPSHSPTYHPPTIGDEFQSASSLPELGISEKLRKIDWFQFEKLMELIYQHRGFSVKRMGGARPDGGVDLIIESPSEKFVVQCKHWRKWTVGVRHIREFLGTLTDSGIPKGVFITLVGYSGEAKQLAEKHGIQILNESDIVEMIEGAGLLYSREISELFSDSRKYCPKCENEMVVRTNRMKGNQFWGCSNYPRCRFILDYEA